MSDTDGWTDLDTLPGVEESGGNPTDYFDTPAYLLPGETVGQTAWGDSVRMYAVDLQAGSTYQFATSGPVSDDPILFLVDYRGSLVTYDDDAGPGLQALINYTAAATGHYYIVLGSATRQSYSVQLSFQQTSSTPSDSVGSSVGHAAPLAAGGSVDGTIDYGGDSDWYAVQLTAGQSYRFALRGSGGTPLTDTFLQLRDGADGHVLAFNDDVDATHNSALRFTPSVSGTYYVAASDWNLETGTYTLSADTVGPQNPIATLVKTTPHLNADIKVYFGLSSDLSGPTGGRAWTPSEIAAVMSAFNQFTGYINVTFTQVSSAAQATVVVALANLGSSTAGVTQVTSATHAEIAFNPASSDWNANGLAPGGSAYQTVMHEMGHALGLAHPHDPAGGSEIMEGVSQPFGQYGVGDLNQQLYTIMSYNDLWSASVNSGLYGTQMRSAATPMALDVAALQTLYTPTAAGAGDTTYQMPTGGGFTTIYDVGGNDTISAAGLSHYAYIDLRPASLTSAYGGGGYVSFSGNYDGGFVIAGGTLIENAIGTSYGDVITGNSLDNNLYGGAGGGDLIHGGGGKDHIYALANAYNQFYGDDGDDLLSVRGAYSSNTLYGGAGDDRILLDDYGGDYIYGGDGVDTAVFSGALASYLISGAVGVVMPSGADLFQDVEFLEFSDATLKVVGGSGTVNGSAAADYIFGSEGADILYGGSGADQLSGSFGDDQLYGGDGDDILTVGEGHDAVFGGAGNDTLVLSRERSFYTLTSLGGGHTDIEGVAGSHVSIDVSGVEAVRFTDQTIGLDGASPPGVPTAGPDTLTGDSGPNQISGLGGADIIFGGGGDDVLASGPAPGAFSAPYLGYAGVSPAWDTGTELDALYGGDGSDMLFAGYGDTVDGGPNGTQSDYLYINFQGAPSGVTADFSLASQTIGGGTIVGIEEVRWVVGSNYNDSLSQGFLIDGMAGDDILTAGYSTTLLYGGDGADILDGSVSQYLQIGDGGAGDDVIYARRNYFQTAYGGDGADTIYTHALTYGGAGDDRIIVETSDYNQNIYGDDGNDWITGANRADVLFGGAGVDRLEGGAGNDVLDGGSNIDTAIFSGAMSAYTLTTTSTGLTVTGPDGTDTLTNIEFLQFSDQTFHFRPGTAATIDFTANPSTYAGALRDFDGNDLGGAGSWVLAGHVDIQGDGDQEYILFNSQIGRWATIGPAADGRVYFDDHGWAGDTRVVGIYIDPEVVADPSKAGGPFDSQRRFQNDLNIGNLKGILGAGDYNHDGLQEVYFSLTDGTAYLHAYMHADGNIQYANYQSQQQVIDYLTANGFTQTTWDGWF